MNDSETLIPYRAAPKREKRHYVRKTPAKRMTALAGSLAGSVMDGAIVCNDDEVRGESVCVNSLRSRLVIAGRRRFSDALFLESDCEITGDENAFLEISGAVTTLGGARKISNNMPGAGGDSLLISGRFKINDIADRRKTITLTGTGGITVCGIIENNSGFAGLTCAGKITITGTSNTFTGCTTVTSGSVLRISSLRDGGSPSSIGAATSVASNLVISGTLQHVGGKASESNRLFTLNSTEGTIVSSDGPSPEAHLAFTNRSELGLGSVNISRSLTLAGANTGANRLNASLRDNGLRSVDLVKKGPGSWIVAGASTFTGGTTVCDGNLILDHTDAAGLGPVMVCDAGGLTLGGGACDGFSIGPGTLVVNGVLRLNSMAACVTLREGTMYVFNGILDLGGAYDSLSPGDYAVITGGVGPGRYIDNLRSITGYAHPEHRVTFRQGVVTIQKKS